MAFFQEQQLKSTIFIYFVIILQHCEYTLTIKACISRFMSFDRLIHIRKAERKGHNYGL